MSDFTIPRCGHGNIILGCPHDDCPEQTAYLADQRERLAAYELSQQQAARRVVREMLGLPEERT